MKKIYEYGKEELVEGENYRLITINGKVYNLIGDIDINENEDIIICSYKTQKELSYGRVYSTIHTVDKSIKGEFIVCQ